jgi:hypothetical protein
MDITANVYTEVNETLTMNRLRVDSESPDDVQIHTRQPTDDQESNVSLFLNRHNAIALRDALTEAIEFFDPPEKAPDA